jgi:preprotein translocase subunit Sec61beta
MAKKPQSNGLSSSAGLVRYFDSSKNNVEIPPKLVMGLICTFGLGIFLLNALM